VSFVYPESLWFLLAVPVLALAFWYNYVSGKKSLIRLIGQWQKRSYRELYFIKKTVRAFSFSIGVLFVVIALGEHPLGQITVEEERQGVEAALVMDISHSMLVEDMGESRLSRGIQLIQGILNQYPQYDFSFTGFKGKGSIFIPMTEDRVIFNSLLSRLSPDLISLPGTNVQSGLAKALDSFPQGRDTYRAIVLFTDGEELYGRMGTIANRVKQNQIKLIVVGLGSSSGGEVPSPQGGVMRNPQGDPVVSRLKEGKLKLLVEDVGGVYISGINSLASQELGDALNLEESVQVSQGVRRQPQSSYPFYTLISLVFFLLYFLTGVIRWKKLF